MPIHSTREHTIISSGARTNTSFSATNPINVGKYSEGVVLVNVTSDSGESPTLSVKLQSFSETLDAWFDQEMIVDTIDVDTAASTDVNKSVPIKNFGDQIRCMYRIGGASSPSVTFAINFVGKM